MTADLIRQAQQGDHAAFEHLIRGAYDRLYGVACRVLRDRVAAEDAVQDAIFRCWRDLRALRDPERFDAWLYRLIVNACRDQARRARHGPVEVYGRREDVVAPHDDYAILADHDALERAFIALPADQRVALVLTHYLGFSAPEVAAIVGVPTGTVYSRIHIGARAMRAALAPPPAARPAATESSR
jgi:RNA polymerase sigma-70 factor (ECF subfamily)